MRYLLRFLEPQNRLAKVLHAAWVHSDRNSSKSLFANRREVSGKQLQLAQMMESAFVTRTVRNALVITEPGSAGGERPSQLGFLGHL